MFHPEDQGTIRVDIIGVPGFGVGTPVPVSGNDLARHSVMVGYGPRVLPATLTGEIRIAIARVCLEVLDGDWVCTQSFRDLESSEMAAVSFYVGMTATSIVAELLGHSYLTHLSAYLKAAGQKIPQGARPDFVSVDRYTNETLALFESKGRARPAGVGAAMAKAKTQLAGSAITAPTRMASVSYFDDDNTWRVLAADPPGEDGVSLDPEVLFYAHYRPVVETMLAARPRQEVEGLVVAEVGEFEFVLPESIFEAVSNAVRERRRRVPEATYILERASEEVAVLPSVLSGRQPSIGRDFVAAVRSRRFAT